MLLKTLHAIDQVITRVVNAAIVVLFLLMLGIAAAQVVLRYFFQSGISWGDPAARTLVLWVGFLGGILATGNNQHFHLDVITRFLPGRFQVWFFRLSNLFGAAVCFFLARASISFLGFEHDSRTFLNLPLVLVDLIIPLGFCLMMVRYAVRMVGEPDHSSPDASGSGEGRDR